MIPLLVRSTLQMPPYLLGAVGAVQHKVSCTTPIDSFDLLLVWGVLWLLIAFVFFALGVIVGLVAFKVIDLLLYDYGSLMSLELR